MEFFIISMLNGLSYGLLLFMLSSGLTLIFSMMGVLNFAHASFYMVGAYVGYTVSRLVGAPPGYVGYDDGGQLTGGAICGHEIECPRHGARFDLRTGAALCPPAYESTAVFPIRIEDDAVWVRDDRWD